MTAATCNQLAEWHLNSAFWYSEQIYAESLFFIKEPTDKHASAKLLFIPDENFKLKSPSLNIEYKEGVDYILRSNSNSIYLTPDSSIPFMDKTNLYRKPDQKLAIAHKQNEKNVWLLFSEGHYFHDLQVEASYKHTSSWKGYTPEYQKNTLSKTIAKLKTQDSLKICLCGDSISAGANASSHIKAKPYMPPYPNLVTEELQRIYDTNVILNNFAAGGKTSQHGVLVAEKIAAEKPDLVIIAYGMNDANNRNIEQYKNNISKIIDITSKDNTNAEYILISPMLGNPEWANTPSEILFSFRDVLKSLCDNGIALADMTQMWFDLLKYKNYHDLTGNGVNHPNDFGHRIYAQVLLNLIVNT